MQKLHNPDYLAKAEQISEEDAERLLSRMTGKLPKRLQKEKLSKTEALAIQMELEDEQLEDWRKMMRKLREKDVAIKPDSKAEESGKTKRNRLSEMRRS